MKKISNYLLAGLCVVALAFSASSFIKVNASTNEVAMAGQPVDLTYAADKALPAVVHIRFVQNAKNEPSRMQMDPFSDFFSDPFGFFGQRRPSMPQKKEGTGSGVIISSDGYIVTNNHVVNDADELTVTLEDNREFNARIIGTDPNTDLALIKINGKNLPSLPIGDSDKIKVGEWVIAVGNPFGLNNTVTAGIVSAKGRSLYQNGVESFIQTDAAINRGNSGGALVNTKGELIGINAMLYSETGSYAGYGFAIPTAIMNKVVDDLKKYGTVQRAFIGIKGQDVNMYLDNLKRQDKDVPDLGTNEGVYVAYFDGFVVCLARRPHSCDEEHGRLACGRVLYGFLQIGNLFHWSVVGVYDDKAIANATLLKGSVLHVFHLQTVAYTKLFLRVVINGHNLGSKHVEVSGAHHFGVALLVLHGDGLAHLLLVVNPTDCSLVTRAFVIDDLLQF